MADPTLLCTLPTGTLVTGAVLNENSGFVHSRLHTDVFWCVEDSDSDANPNNCVYAIGYDGTLKKAIRITGLTRTAEQPALYGQWEDMAYHDTSNTVWVSNCGNNGHDSDQFWGYKFTEPSDITLPGTVADVPATGQFLFEFDDAPAGGWNCECMIASPAARLYFVNKEAAADTGLYEAPETLAAAPTVNTLVKVASLTAQGGITGGDWSPNGDSFIISAGNQWGYQYETIAPYNQIGERFSMPMPLKQNGTSQPESLCFTKDGFALLRGSEGAGSEVYFIPLDNPGTGGGDTTYTWRKDSTVALTLRYRELSGPNLVANPSFEVDALNWTPIPNSSTITRANAVTAHDGSWYGRFEFGSDGHRNLDSAEFAVTAGQPYSFGFFARWLTGATPRDVRLDVRWRDSASGALGTDTGSRTATVTGSWTAVTRTSMVAPASAAKAVLRVVCLDALASEAVGIDLAEAKLGTTL